MAQLIDTYRTNRFTGERSFYAVNTSGTPKAVQAFYQSQSRGAFIYASQYRGA